ncbi:hypothetical protein LCGC14_0523150 [marine sediment metagenome]|uniref:Uncharacterized protein n=1 Tax=marine sediment metagenome TaxID=412755 RepID=A0A0F9S2R2_9ZZZZ
MTCDFTKPIYSATKRGGCSLARSAEDGYTIQIFWDQAYESVLDYDLGYNVYYSTIREDVFTEGVKFVSIDGATDGYVIELTPGDVYYFAVKGAQHDPSWFNLALLPDSFPGFKAYPEGLLLSDISTTDVVIPLSDIDQFPAFGVIQVGTEIMRYISKDIPSSSVLVSERGFLGTNIRFHDTDGYDGIETRDPIVRFWRGYEDDNERVQQETASFAFPNHAFTAADGYAIKSDIITTNLGASDTSIESFPKYDFVGWHRTDPSRLLRGDCIGTYYGGEQWCADGYLGIGRQLRGVPINEQAARREEVLLNTWGEPVMLVRRLWSGIRCSCILSTTEQPEHRCIFCFGTGFSTGYEQFFNSRKSDGKIRVRFGPTQEDVKMDSAGLENVFIPDCWTLVYPAIRDRDFIIRFDEDGVEEFRYEILNVTRNILAEGKSGAQKFSAQRIRKTDPIYMWSAIDTTATMPQTLTTSIGLLRGLGGLQIPHIHNIVINEGIVSLSQINQTTSVSEGHNHQIRNGIVLKSVGHAHSIIL